MASAARGTARGARAPRRASLPSREVGGLLARFAPSLGGASSSESRAMAPRLWRPAGWEGKEVRRSIPRRLRSPSTAVRAARGGLVGSQADAPSTSPVPARPRHDARRAHGVIAPQALLGRDQGGEDAATPSAPQGAEGPSAAPATPPTEPPPSAPGEPTPVAPVAPGAPGAVKPGTSPKGASAPDGGALPPVAADAAAPAPLALPSGFPTALPTALPSSLPKGFPTSLPSSLPSGWPPPKNANRVEPSTAPRGELRAHAARLRALHALRRHRARRHGGDRLGACDHRARRLAPRRRQAGLPERVSSASPIPLRS